APTSAINSHSWTKHYGSDSTHRRRRLRRFQGCPPCFKESNGEHLSKVQDGARSRGTKLFHRQRQGVEQTNHRSRPLHRSRCLREAPSTRESHHRESSLWLSAGGGAASSAASARCASQSGAHLEQRTPNPCAAVFSLALGNEKKLRCAAGR